MSDIDSTDEMLAAIVADGRRALSASARPTGAVVLLAGVVHLLAPGLLLWLARRGYALVLDVDFSPGAATTRRVRGLGVAMILAGAHLLYYDGIRPA